jgi:hypothetical protein
MATQDKIEFHLTSGSSYYFKTIQYKPSPQRQGMVEQHFSGIDVMIAPMVEAFSYVIRVPIDATSGSEGNYDDLYDMLQLANPVSTPASSFRFVDHFENSWTLAWIKPGSVNIQPLTTQLEGPNAYMMVPIDVVCQIYEFPDHTDFSDPESSYNILFYF